MKLGLLYTLVVAASLVSSAGLGADEAPLRKVDLMRVVGRPVLDTETTPEGLFVYLHRGRIHIAATPRKEDIGRGKKTSYQLRISADQNPSAVELGSFQRQKHKGDKSTWHLTVHVGKRAEKLSFKLDGELVVFDARVGAGSRTSPARILLGPLGRRGAASVSLGRY